MSPVPSYRVVNRHWLTTNAPRRSHRRLFAIPARGLRTRLSIVEFDCFVSLCVPCREGSQEENRDDVRTTELGQGLWRHWAVYRRH